MGITDLFLAVVITSLTLGSGGSNELPPQSYFLPGGIHWHHSYLIYYFVGSPESLDD